MNEYITDNLWKFNEIYSVNDFKSLSDILNINKDNIYKNYLNDICLNNKLLFADNDITMIKKEFINIFTDSYNELDKQKKSMIQQKENLKELKLSYSNITGKIKKIKNQMDNILKKIKSIQNISTNNYIDPNIGKIQCGI